MRRLRRTAMAALAAACVALCCGCPSAQVAKPVIEPRMEVAPRVEAQGDVSQHLESIQSTLTRIEQNQGLTPKVAEQIDRVEKLVQQNTQYGSSPEDAKLKAQTARLGAAQTGGVALAVLGLLLLMLGLPAIGGAMILIAGISCLALGAGIWVLAPFLL